MWMCFYVCVCWDFVCGIIWRFHYFSVCPFWLFVFCFVIDYLVLFISSSSFFVSKFYLAFKWIKPILSLCFSSPLTFSYFSCMLVKGRQELRIDMATIHNHCFFTFYSSTSKYSNQNFDQQSFHTYFVPQINK